MRVRAGEKMKKSITKILMFLGFIVASVGLLIGGLDEEGALLVFTSIFTAPSIAMALAVCFIFSKNNVLKNVGYTLATLSGIYGVTLLT